MLPHLTTGRQSATAKKRFWAKINKEGPIHPTLGSRCWLWLGKLGSHGYGMVMVNHVRMTAPRFSWILHRGEISRIDTYHGICVLHKCDNRACVNPNHLFLGTQADNMKDMARKGRAYNQKEPYAESRARRSTRPKKAKLSFAQVNEIKELLSTPNKQGMSLRDIAAKYEVSHNTIWLIGQGAIWRDK